MAEDPSMVEFLRTLHDYPQIDPVAHQSVKLPTPDTSSAAGLQDKARSMPEPLPEGPALSLSEHLITLRTVLKELSRVADESERIKILHELLQQVELVKQGSEPSHLRPVRLLASALQGLLKQLSIKASNMTPSTLRTTVAAIDLLDLLITRKLRPNLATDPPVRLLAVDDDPISRRAVAIALKKTFNEPDLASDGQTALEFASRQSYDLILLDVEMQGLDGFEVCSKIRETAPNRTTPVVFVTSHSDFDSRAKSALLGARDLISKPFLSFEITVKALTLVLRARLDDLYAKHTVNDIDKSHPVVTAADPAGPQAANPVAPPLLSQPIASVELPGENAKQARILTKDQLNKVQSLSISAPALAETSSRPQDLIEATSLDRLPPSSGEFARAFFKGAPAHLKSLGEKLASARDAVNPIERGEILAEIFIGVHTLCSDAGRAQLGAAVRVCSTLEAVLRKVVERPASRTPSTLDTAAAALHTIKQLCQLERDLDLALAPVRLLVVDDDAVARRAICGALQLAITRPDSADCGEAALTLAGDKTYDLIFLDVLMPGMDGFVVCSKLHELALNRLTPVIFVTGHDDTDSRAKAASAGAVV